MSGPIFTKCYNLIEMASDDDLLEGEELIEEAKEIFAAEPQEETKTEEVKDMVLRSIRSKISFLAGILGTSADKIIGRIEEETGDLSDVSKDRLVKLEKWLSKKAKKKMVK